MFPEKIPPIDGTSPGNATLDEVLDKLYNQITGPDGDRDGYLKREAIPTPAQRSYRDKTVAHPEILN